MTKKLLLAEIVVTSMLVGLIWTIQLINYPSFHFVGIQDYPLFHTFHVDAITPFVGSLMIIELAMCLANNYRHSYSKKLGGTLLILIFIIWGTTLFISVPIHEKLLLGKNDLLIQKLVLTNWIRTIAWSLRLVLLFFQW